MSTREIDDRIVASSVGPSPGPVVVRDVTILPAVTESDKHVRIPLERLLQEEPTLTGHLIHALRM